MESILQAAAFARDTVVKLRCGIGKTLIAAACFNLFGGGGVMLVPTRIVAVLHAESFKTLGLDCIVASNENPGKVSAWIKTRSANQGSISVQILVSTPKSYLSIQDNTNIRENIQYLVLDECHLIIEFSTSHV
jgi:superfamily II DNA or RNA helicase